MTWHPSPPPGRHVWVRGHGEHGVPNAGVVVSWQHTPVHSAAGHEWSALVAQAPFGAALLVDWVGAGRLVPVRDDSATEGRPVPRAPDPPRRHAWVDGGAGHWNPALVLEWRRTPHGWEAHVAAVRRHSVLLTWTAAATLRPVTDDRWQPGA